VCVGLGHVFDSKLDACEGIKIIGDRGAAMSKLFQVYEDDLGELERILPQLSEALTPSLDNRLRVQLRRCQTILSHVRWDYGPATEVRIIPADGESDHSL
jgi:hypothetical protein